MKPLICCLLSALLLLACDDGGGSTPDVGSTDTVSDSGGTDTSVSSDTSGGQDTSTPPDTTPPDTSTDSSTCTGDCPAIDLLLEFRNETRNFDRAYYGITAPAASDSGQYELYIEAYAGGAEGCPTQSSPTPDLTLVIASIPLPEGEPLETTSTLLDFSGAILPNTPFQRATEITLTPTDANLCTECLGNPEPSHAEGFAALNINIVFPEGVVSGKLYATHCDSFDLSTAP